MRIHSRRRTDLELPNIECIWVEVNFHNKNILLGTFSRPPTSSAQTLSYIEDSISLAIDSNIKDIFITGDFNLDMIKATTNKKNNNICQYFNFYQLIEEPNHFTETSSSIIDLVFTSNKKTIYFQAELVTPFLNKISGIIVQCILY